MGARGIKRRKPKHELHDLADDLVPGDERRVFGRFETGAYTPWGQVERAGFFARQFGRRTDHAVRDALRMTWLSVPIVLGVILACAILALVVHYA